MDKYYRENDKIMLCETGQIYTVHEDLSDQQEPGIAVKEKFDRLLMSSEVRPAGRTRERWDAGVGITEPDWSPPPPSNSIFLP